MLKRKPVPANQGGESLTQPVMPGSFLPRDALFAQLDGEISHNPWETADTIADPLNTLHRIQELITSSAANEVSDFRLEVVDWRKVEPPAALRKAPNVTSQILLDVVQSSIDNVRDRIRNERREEVMAEEQRVAEEQAARREEQKGKQPYLPIIMVQEETAQEGNTYSESWPLPAEPSSLSDMPLEQPRRSSESLRDLAPVRRFRETMRTVQKPRESAIRRLFKRSTDKGESSAEGSAREGLLQRLMEARGSSEVETNDEKTDRAVARLKRRLKPSSEADTLHECVSCLEDIPMKACVRVQCHVYCTECFVRLVSTACENETQWPPKCCLNNIPFALIRKNIPSSLRKTFNERSSEWEIPIGERVYCWRADCGLFIRPSKIKTSASVGACDKGHWTCLDCRNEGHGQGDCPMDQALVLTNQMAEEEGWRRCYQCRALVEHAEACQHMTCRCGAQFCYVCGLQWRTCECSIVDLDNVKEQAQERREQRRQREEEADADAEELRAILEQIEAFEKEEERKAALLAEQRRKEAQERRERELLERVKAESARVRDIGLKFQHLRETLDGLHDLQFVLVETDQEEAAASLANEEQLATAQLNSKHENRREELVKKLVAKLSAQEHAFAKEYETRAIMEAKVESTFREELLEYWGDHKDGPAEIEAAMLPLQQRMDRKFRAWKKSCAEAADQLRESQEEEMTVQEELMWSSQQLLKTRQETKRKELSRRNVAEKHWVEVVILEREKMMNVMEAEEIEDDADILQQSDIESEGEWQEAHEEPRDSWEA